MKIDTEALMPLAEANRNFSKVVKMVDEHGMIVILRNNKPRYVVVEFNEYEEIRAMREKAALMKAGELSGESAKQICYRRQTDSRICEEVQNYRNR